MNFTDNDYIIINNIINGDRVSDDELAEVKQKLEYNVEAINLRKEFMDRAEALDKKFIKKEDK